MNVQTKFAAIAFSILVSSGVANGMDLKDARQYAASLLNKYGPVPVTVTTRHQACFWHCEFVSNEGVTRLVNYTPDLSGSAVPALKRPLVRMACAAGAVPQQVCHSYDTASTVSRILDFGQIQLTFPDQIKFGKPEFHSLPDEIYMDALVVQNCSTTPKKGSVGKSLSLSVTATSSTTVTSGISDTVGFNLSVKYGAAQFGSFGGGVKYSETITQSTAQSTGVSQTYADTTNQVIDYPPPKSAAMAEFKVYKLTSRLPFSVDTVIDAPLEPNQKGLKMLSDVASVGERSVPIEGYITLAGFSKAIADVVDVKYDESRCSDAGPDGIAYIRGPSPEILDAAMRSKRSQKTLELRQIQ